MRRRCIGFLVMALLAVLMLSCKSGLTRQEPAKPDALSKFDETQLPPITGRIALAYQEFSRLRVIQHPELRCCFFGSKEDGRPKVIAWYWRSNNRLMAAYEIVCVDYTEPQPEGVAFKSIQKNFDKTVWRSLVDVSLQDDRKDLLVFDGSEEFVLREGSHTEKLRFRPLLAFSGSVRKLGTTLMTAETATRLVERGDRADLQYVATQKDGKVAFAKKLPVTTVPGGIISKSVAMRTGMTAPWNVKNTSTQTVLFTYKIMPPLTVVDGPSAGSFTLAPGEARTVCNVTSETPGSHPMHFSQTPLEVATPASGDIDNLAEIDKLVWEGGPAKGPIVFDTTTGRAVVDDGMKELELAGYTEDALTVARVNDVKVPTSVGEKKPLGGIGDKVPFIVAGLGALVVTGPNVFKGTTVAGGKMETFFTAVPLELPAEELDRVKTADGVVAIAVETTDLGRELGYMLLPKFNLYPSLPGVVGWGGKRYGGGDLQIVTRCPKVKSVTITFHPSGEKHTLALGQYLPSKSPPWTVTIPAKTMTALPSDSSAFTVTIATKCSPTEPTKVTSEIYADDRPPSGGTGGGRPPSAGGGGGGEPKPEEKAPPEVITAGNTENVEVGSTRGGTIAGGSGTGGVSGTASGGSGGTAPGGGGGSPQGGGATAQGGGSGAGSANVGTGNIGGTTGGGTTSSTGGTGTSQGGAGTGGQGGQGGQAPGGAGTSGDAGGGQGGDVSQADASATGGKIDIKPEVEINKTNRAPTTALDLEAKKLELKIKEMELKIKEMELKLKESSSNK